MSNIKKVLEQVEQLRASAEGNRNSALAPSKSKKQSIQCRNICITVNNWNLEQKSNLLKFFEEHCEKYVLAREVGKCGTPHLQGAFVLKKKDRFEGVFNKLGFKCHLEKMIGNWRQQINYCSKDGDIIAKFSPDCDDDDLDCLTEDMLYPWQLELLEMVKGKADKRIVHWYWEPKGNSGKSEFTRFLGINHNACIIQKGKYADLMNHVFMTKNVRIFIIDVPRSSGNNVSYNAIESIKSGIIFNSKYETGQKFINSPHIIVFANEKPDMSKLSADRWNVVRIDENEEDDEISVIDDDLEM